MKLKFFILGTLLLLSQSIAAQKIHLDIFTDSASKDSLINPIQKPNNFNSKKELRSAIQSLNDSLYIRGYFQHYFTEITSDNPNSTSLKLHLGKRTDSITLTTTDHKLIETLEKSSIPFSKNKYRIAISQLQPTLQKLITTETNSGFPLSSINLTNIRKIGNHTEATLILTREQQRLLNTVSIKGYDKFPKSFLKHFLKISKTTLFKRDEIISITKNLENIPFIQQTQEPELFFSKDSTNLYLYIKKKNINRLEGFLGFASREDNSKLRVDGNLDLALTNNFNYGESINLLYKSNGDEQQTFNLNTHLPYIFKTPLSLSAQLNIFRQDSIFSNTTQGFGISYNITPQTLLKLDYTFKNSTTPTPLASTEEFTKNRIDLGFQYNRRTTQSFFNNTETIKIHTGISQRQTENTVTQFSIDIEAVKSINISNNTQIHLKNKTHFLQSSNYLTNELERFGGMNTLRGFKENSLNANTFSSIQSEFRYTPSSKLYINSIFDLAYIKNDITNQENTLYSFGFGTSFLTQSGTLKLNLANGLKPKEGFDFSNTILHLTFLTVF